MAREYNPSPKDPVNVKFSKDKRKIGDRKVTLHVAVCQEDGERVTGDTEAEAARYFAGHLSNKHPGRQVRKV
jgi:hypothetical protein